MQEEEISLYIHIPFCAKKCSYCDFYSVKSKGIEEELSYTRALVNEIRERAELVKRWTSVYIGGGTPSLLSGSALSFIMKSVEKAAPFDGAEVTMEVNPEDVTEDLLSSMREAGINRLSLGVESFTPLALKSVSRRSNRDRILSALSCIKKRWHESFSLDLIAGLPGETRESFEESLKIALQYEPHHISVYSLMLEEGTELYRMYKSGKVDLNEEEADEEWIKACNLLIDKGYLHYEVSNFSKRGYASTHNLSYWKLKNYLGVGAAAVSGFYNRDAGERRVNCKNVALYTAYWLKDARKREEEKAAFAIEKLSKKDMMSEYFMLGFRLTEGVSRKEFASRFGCAFPKGVEEALQRWRKRGKLMEEGGRVSLTEEGRFFLNEFLLEFI